jgi:hypothetical protein
VILYGWRRIERVLMRKHKGKKTIGRKTCNEKDEIEMGLNE